MQKRAQVTTFIILGIVIVAVVGIFLYARNIGLGISPERFITTKRFAIEDRIEECVQERADRIIDIIGNQGGTLIPIRHKSFQGHKINYLCYNIPGQEQCVNRILTLSSMEEQITRHLEDNLRNCLNINSFRTSGLSLQDSNIEITTTIGQNNMLVIVDYPITISRDESTVTLPKRTVTINKPLGKLFLTAMDIVESEAQVGDFDPLPYMISHNTIRIEKHRPFPDKIYIISERYNPYKFQVAIEGER